MRLRNRFLLVGSGVVVFVLITPILVLYARGFKIDWENKSIVKTGALVIKTEPNKADIYLNNEKIDQTTPVNIRFLPPKDYDIRIEKDGYQPWMKRLNVRSQLVTWANNDREFITLFLKNPTLLDHIDTDEAEKLFKVEDDLNPEELQKILIDLNISVPNFTTQKIIRTENQIYLILDDTLYFLNDSLEKIYSPVNFANWNNETRQLLYSNTNEIYLYQADGNNSDLILRSITPIQIPILNPETGYLFYQNENKIKAVELDSRDLRNNYTILNSSDDYRISEDGTKLYTKNELEIKSYQIR